MQPAIINFPVQTVLYVQEKGDYAKTPEIALRKLIDLLNGKGVFQGIYGMGLDNPGLTDSEACRFDACAKIELDGKIELVEAIQKKEIGGGQFAVFTHEGPYSKLNTTCNKIFQEWFPTSGYHPAGSLFCEYINYLNESAEVEVKIYVPIKA